MVSSEVEELSDDLKREFEEELREGMGKTTIAFFDIADMSTNAKIGYAILVLIFFTAIGFVCY